MQEWISVKDRLPEDEQSVLMCDKEVNLIPHIGWYESEPRNVSGFYLANTFLNVRFNLL